MESVMTEQPPSSPSLPTLLAALLRVCAGSRRAPDIGPVDDRSRVTDANPQGQKGRRTGNVRTGDQRFICRADPKPVAAQLNLEDACIGIS